MPARLLWVLSGTNPNLVLESSRPTGGASKSWNESIGFFVDKPDR
jgi:hypothetical protein